jgi:hypothetical protein
MAIGRPRIEYLDLYLSQLAHQRNHGGGVNLSWREGLDQPWEWCPNCLRVTPPDAKDLNHQVKRKYAWAVPNEDALRAIAAVSPRGVVEIGAGGGYWAMLLRERGVEVIAYDPDPDGLKDWHAGRRWSEVLYGDHTAVIGHSDRTLFLCWPEYNKTWAQEALELYEGETVVYVGEGFGGCTADDQFHALLGDDVSCWHPGDDLCDHDWPAPLFNETNVVDIPQWCGLYDSLKIYQRMSTES